MDSSQSPQRGEKSLFLRGLEVMLCDTLKKSSETVKEESRQIAAYVVQNIDAKPGAVAFQARNKIPARLIH